MFIDKQFQTVPALLRRTFLLRTAGIVAFPLSLAGCGGGGGDPSPPEQVNDPTVVPVVMTQSAGRGIVVMPAGASVRVASVTNVYASNAPAADGGFAFVSAAESRLLAVGADTDGNTLLYGLLQSGKGELSARSTAVVLAYAFLGVGVYLEQAQLAYLSAIESSPDLRGLENAVAAALVARGSGWLDPADTVLVGAIAAIQASLSAPARQAASLAREGRSATLGIQGSDVEVRPLGISLDKTDRTSGLQVTTDGIGSLQVTNYYRRRSYLYVDRVSYRTEYTGADHDAKATINPYPTKMPAVKGISNAFVTLGQLFGGNLSFYQPVTTDAIAVPLAPTEAVLTHYTVTAVGLGANDGDSSSLTNEQELGLALVSAETIVLDLVVPIICGILIPTQKVAIDDWVEFKNGNGILKDLVGAIAASPDIIAKAKAGKSAEAGWDALLLIVKSETLKRALLAFFQFGAEKMFKDSAARDNPKFVSDGTKKVLDFVSAVNVGFQAFDIAVIGVQISLCNRVDQFAIDVTKSNVKLNPLNPSIDWPVQKAFTLSVIDADVPSGSALSYTWKCTCVWGDISDGLHTNAANGNSFDSTSPTLTYAPNTQHALGGEQEVITGIAYFGQINNRVPLGQATTTITYNAPITPDNPSLAINTDQTFTAGISTKLLQSGRALKYVWTVTGGHGTVGGAATQTTDTPSVVYRAGVGGGSDTMSLKVVDLLQVVYTSGSTQILVANALFTISPPTIDIAGPLTVYSFDAQGAAALPTDTTYRWTTKNGNMAPPNTDWTNNGTKQIVGGPRADYSVPEAFPTNGVGKTDTVTCEALNPAGTVLVSAQATVTYGDQPYVRFKYFDTQAGRVLDIPVTSGISVRRSTNAFAGTDLIEISVADGNGGAVFNARLVVAIGGNLAGSFTFVSANGLNGNKLVPGQGYFLGRLHSPQITGGVLTVNSSVPAPGGGTYVGFSFNWDTTMSGSPVVGNGVVLLTP